MDKLKNQALEVVQINKMEAEEFREYKRLKKIAEITGAISRSSTSLVGSLEIKESIDCAIRFHQAAVQVTPLQIRKAKMHLQNSKVKIDCRIGGNGETVPQIKRYETRFARKAGANELTLVLSSTAIFTSDYGQIQKEIKQVQRASKGLPIKVWMDKKYPFSVLARMARLCSEMNVAYVSVPYFVGCERLRYDLFKNCELEVSNIDTLSDFKKMTGAGVGRVITSQVAMLRSSWMKEVENCMDSCKKELENK